MLLSCWGGALKKRLTTAPLSVRALHVPRTTKASDQAAQGFVHISLQCFFADHDVRAVTHEHDIMIDPSRSRKKKDSADWLCLQIGFPFHQLTFRYSNAYLMRRVSAAQPPAVACCTSWSYLGTVGRSDSELRAATICCLGCCVRCCGARFPHIPYGQVISAAFPLEDEIHRKISPSGQGRHPNIRYLCSSPPAYSRRPEAL